jgi:hypothetical protein
MVHKWRGVIWIPACLVPDEGPRANARPCLASCSRHRSKSAITALLETPPTKQMLSPPQSLSWTEGLRVQAELTWLSSHGWSCSRWAQSVSGVTRAYLNRFWMAEVVQMYLYRSSLPVCSEIALADMAAERPGLPTRGRGPAWSVWAGRSKHYLPQQAGSTPNSPPNNKTRSWLFSRERKRATLAGGDGRCPQSSVVDRSRSRGEKIVKIMNVAPDTVVSSHNSPHLGGRGGRITRSRPAWAI